MLTVAHPWLALLLPLPLLVRLIWHSHRERRISVRAPFLDQMATQLGLEAEEGPVAARRTWVQATLLVVLWLLIVGALVRPQWVGEPIEHIESARDLMLLVDLSGSMSEADFTSADGTRVTRLDAVKLVLEHFVQERSTDRLGLVVFGNAAFLQCPFTLDHAVFTELLDEVEVGMAGPRTMLGDALGLAVKSFDASEAEQKTAILLTDGNDTGSSVPPTKAAELAARRDLTFHVIGVGDPRGSGRGAAGYGDPRRHRHRHRWCVRHRRGSGQPGCGLPANQRVGTARVRDRHFPSDHRPLSVAAGGLSRARAGVPPGAGHPRDHQ
jgi:Ca-activated chloride channel family protein